jgi:predicted SnoaL-like aldol condensation-catalyzing enzyme
MLPYFRKRRYFNVRERDSVTTLVRSAREVVEAYNLVAWNKQDLALAEELLADRVIRHEVGGVRTLTRAQAIQRIADTWEMFSALRFELKLVVAGDDDEHVAIAYQATMTLKDRTNNSIGSIEIFRVVDGRIVEVYNCGHQQGAWE